MRAAAVYGERSRWRAVDILRGRTIAREDSREAAMRAARDQGYQPVIGEVS